MNVGIIRPRILTKIYDYKLKALMAKVDKIQQQMYNVSREMKIL